MTITALYLYDAGFAEYGLLYTDISVNVYEYETKKTQFIFIIYIYNVSSEKLKTAKSD